MSVFKRLKIQPHRQQAVSEPLDYRGLREMGGAVGDLVEQEAAEARVAAQRAAGQCWEMVRGISAKEKIAFT